MVANVWPNISNTGYWDDPHPHHTCSDALCNWIANYFGDKDKVVYDFACGVGQYLRRLKDSGFTKLTGFEGRVPDVREFDNILQQDLTKPFDVVEKGNVVFLEAAEHIPARFEYAMLANVANACDDKLVMSWALRNQGGHGHVNELNNDEAIERVIKHGLTYLPEETARARAVILDGDWPWFKNTTLVFSKNK